MTSWESYFRGRFRIGMYWTRNGIEGIRDEFRRREVSLSNVSRVDLRKRKQRRRTFREEDLNMCQKRKYDILTVKFTVVDIVP